MKIQRYIIILVAMLCAIAGFSRPATDNKTFERLYNLSPEAFFNQLDFFAQHNQIDSAMLYANIQASKYGKENLTKDELEACCIAFRYMGLEYLVYFYDYQLAAKNLLKAEQIAEKYQFQVQAQITNDKAALAAMQNDLQNNFAFNKDVLDGFKKSFYPSIDLLTKKNTEIDRIILETTAPNLLYLAIKFDKTKEVVKEVEVYREAQKRYGTSCNVAEVFCNAVEYCNAGNYDKAFETLQTPINHPESLSEQNHIQSQVMAKLAQYAVLVKSGKRAEALSLLIQQEQFMHEKGMTFEQLEVLQLIWQHYEKEGNKALADKYALLYYTTKDEFINKSRLGKIDQAKLNLELEETRERIREMSYRQQMQTILLWSSIIIALLALTILGVLYANYRKTKRTNRLLYEKNVALLNDNKQLRPIAESPQKTTKDELSSAVLELLDKITAVMESSPEVFNEAFSLNRLAELVGSNTKYVSRAINIGKQCNFSVLLNEYRIKEACRRLMDTENYGNYTIEGIANSVGYKSRSNFATIFKESIGLTPSAFQRLSRDGENVLDLGEG